MAMGNELEKYLLEAEGKEKEELSLDNIYRHIGFDREKKRLGWVRVLPFSLIEERLSAFSNILDNKEDVVFIGMGGSINGIKPLVSLFESGSFYSTGEHRYKIYTLDNLDPRASGEVLKKIRDIDKTLIVPISKSGTTQETQLLASTFKEIFTSNWEDHFCWLSDPTSFEKIDALGWQKVKKMPIQFDGETDIGGRFSSPHTLIFFLPLFLLLNKDFSKLKNIYEEYVSSLKEVREKAYYYAQYYKDNKYAYFYPVIDGRENLSSWIIQLFQESLGSKKRDMPVKTLSFPYRRRDDFLPLQPDFKIDNPFVSLMCEMYFFQIFIAYYAGFKEVNFVTQDVVEKYKNEMRKLEGMSLVDAAAVDLDSLVTEVRKNIKDEHKFIEIVLYCYSSKELLERIKMKFKDVFSDKIILLFIGSDWNHHSYQAAVEDKHTFYVFLLASSYETDIPPFSEETLKNNVQTLRLISRATHLTLKEKSLLFSL
jgi:hypothetical protein